MSHSTSVHLVLYFTLCTLIHRIFKNKKSMLRFHQFVESMLVYPAEFQYKTENFAG